MIDQFAALEAMLSSAVNARLGAPLRFLPKAKTDSHGTPRAVDARQPVDVVGTVVDGDEDMLMLSGDRQLTNVNGRMIAQRAWATVPKSNLLALSYAPRKGDKIQTLDDAGEPLRTFEIVDITAAGSADFDFLLTVSAP